MQSQWNHSEAARCSSKLALRAYTSRLLGADTSLVLHGGGNTSAKLDEGDTLVLYVKGTGSDLARVDERAFTPLQLDAVMSLLQQEDLDNAGMMRELDACLMRRPAPRPSIETLLHAGLPFRFVEHTHADAVLAAMNVEDIEATHAGVYGELAPLVPYHHSGHALARACMEVFHARRTPRTIGLILAFHGVVAFGDDAHASYENMIELVTRAENFLQAHGAWNITPATLTAPEPDAAALQKLHAEVNTIAGVPLAMHTANDAQCMTFAQHADIAKISQQGPATPQHAVYTKRVPLAGRDVRAYAARYRDYLDTHLGKEASALIDAAPRIVLDAAFGMCAFGATARDAMIAAEMYRHDIAIITRASTHGRYRAAPPAAIAQAEFEYGGYAARRQKPVSRIIKIFNKFNTLRWGNNALEMLDQRALPVRVEYLRYDSAAAVAEGIRTMVVRGAPAIGCAAAYGVALEALRLQDESREVFLAGLEQGFTALAASRPTAVNLYWALNRMRAKLDSLHTAPVAKIADVLLAEAHAITEEDVRLNREMGQHGAALLADNMRMLTHCNAGALATAGHGTALGVIRSAVEAGKKIRVYADETRPFLQGARLTVWELMQDDIPVTLVADNASGWLLSQGEIDAVIVGADRIAANGDVANKIGTYNVAVLARRHGVPFYVAAPLSTIDLKMPSGSKIPIEERAPDEVTGYGDTQWAPHGVAVRNPVFDVTPAELVTALITERGVVCAPDAAKIAALFEHGSN